jgi:hypothetical protein
LANTPLAALGCSCNASRCWPARGVLGTRRCHRRCRRRPAFGAVHHLRDRHRPGPLRDTPPPSPRGRDDAPAITSRPASASRARRGADRSGWLPPWRSAPRQPGGPRAPTCRISSSACAHAVATASPARPSSTRSSSLPSTSSNAGCPTTISAPTGSKSADLRRTRIGLHSRSQLSATESRSSQPKPPETSHTVGTSSRAGLRPAPRPRAPAPSSFGSDSKVAGRLAQLVRAAGLQPAGRGFESLSAH